MNWLQLELEATPATLTSIEAALEASGAVSIALVSAADEPVLEPAPGETPLWQSVRVRALLGLDTDLAHLRQALTEAGAGAITDVTFVGEDDWQSAARSHAVDRIFAERLHLLPKSSAQAPAADSDHVALYLEPGLAFGSGSHPTTSMCLEWLAANVEPGMHVLDFGCGSGVLGIAAALLGGTVEAVDHDEQAVVATVDNAAYNGLTTAQLRAVEADVWHERNVQGAYDVIVANILAGPLQALAAGFERAAKPGGAIVLSGVLAEQADAVMNAYTRTTFTAPKLEAGWALLAGVTAVTE